MGTFQLGGALRGISFPAAPVSFAPTDIAGCVLWLDASQLALANNDPVASWTDISGIGNNAVQATGANQPVFKTAALNGKPAVRFDGSTDFLVAPSIDAPSYTLWAVYMTTNSVASSRTLSTSTNTLIGPFGAFYQGFDGGFALGPAVVNNQFIVHIFTHTSGVGGAAFVNGVAAGTTAGTQSLGVTIGVGATAAAAGLLPGDVPECGAYNNAISGANRALLEAYLLAKYALP